MKEMKIFLVILFMQKDGERVGRDGERITIGAGGAHNDKLQKFAVQHFAVLGRFHNIYR
jgi:hypothetical protein